MKNIQIVKINKQNMHFLFKGTRQIGKIDSIQIGHIASKCLETLKPL